MQAAIASANPGLHSLLVIRNGYLVSESYFLGYDRNSLPISTR